jgi:hypothetical protein
MGKFTGKVLLAKRQAEWHGIDHVSVYVNGVEYRHYPGEPADLYAEIEEALNRLQADGNE